MTLQDNLLDSSSLNSLRMRLWNVSLVFSNELDKQLIWDSLSEVVYYEMCVEICNHIVDKLESYDFN